MFSVFIIKDLMANLLHMGNREPDFLIVYTFVDAKNTPQPAVQIQPDFAQVA